jgi:uncharacterized membrane protein YeaQ/YmgE (transglycosylase-associated protein family)
MGILLAIVIGGLVGAFAKILIPGKDAGGVIITMLLGIAGSAAASVTGRALGWYPTLVSVPALATGLLGAALVLFAYRRLVIARRTA